LIGKNEEEEHGEVTRPDQELAEEKKEKEPVKLSRSPDPVSNDTKHRDRLEDHGNKIQAVGIVELVELIMMREPAAAVKKAIHPDGADQGNRGINDRLGFHSAHHSSHVTCHLLEESDGQGQTRTVWPGAMGLTCSRIFLC